MRIAIFLATAFALLAARTAMLECTQQRQWGEHRHWLEFRSAPAHGWKVVKARLMVEAPLPRRGVEAGVTKETAKVKAEAAGAGFTSLELPPAMAEELLAGRAGRLYVRGFERIGRSTFLTVEGSEP